MSSADSPISAIAAVARVPQHTVRMPAIHRPATSQLLSLLLVALLHALLLFAILHFMVVTPKATIVAAPEHLLEIIINTAKKPAPVSLTAPRSRPAPTLPKAGGVTSGAMPSYTPPVARPDITGLGQALFGCAPENLPNLTPDQRAHCTNGFTRPDENALVEPKSHVKDPLRREAEMRAKNTPGRVPCTSVTNVGGLAGNTAAPTVNPICIIGGLINGFGPLNGLDK
ncbi:MAG TPA: hypothetical protein VGG66_03245 [Rhizomicrobium sp.]